uniref:Neuronal regeneration-related protein n=1 Tax=Strigops habroptila TaxID=2489341 RepID=A0A672TQL2_STRHB
SFAFMTLKHCVCLLCFPDAKQGSLPISKEVNRKKKSEAEGASLVPVNGYGHHFTKINYLYSF